MKRILYLSFYFEPDLCAGSFRNSPLARELARQVAGKAIVDVITTMPNRYSSFAVSSKEEESIGNLNIRRISLPIHHSGYGDQVNSFRHFFKEALKIVKGQHYDLVFASSSRLFTAYLGYKIAKKIKAPLYLDIRDIFSDTMNDVLQNKPLKSVLMPMLNYIEHRVFSYASHINLISEGFHPYFKKFSKPAYSFFTNGIDEDFILNENEPGFQFEVKDPLVITYAGNIGHGQGLHKIIPEAALLAGDGYFFRVIGDGGSLALLENEIEKLQVKNVRLEKPVKRKELIEIYKRSHFLFIHLNDYKAFEKVLPSKVFEAGAIPRPVLAGVKGYARKFISDNIDNAILFEPGNAKELIDKLKAFQFQNHERKLFISEFKRDKINTAMAASIIQYL